MNNFEEEEAVAWRSRLQLAQQGNAQAVEEVKRLMGLHIEGDHVFATANYAQVTQLPFSY